LLKIAQKQWRSSSIQEATMQRHTYDSNYPHWNAPKSILTSSLNWRRNWRSWLHWLGWTLPIAIGLFATVPTSAQSDTPAFSLTAGFEARRVALPERMALQHTTDCGYIPAEPTATVTLEEDFFYLNFSLIDATPETTLLVVSLDNDGERFCSRGEVGQSGYWQAGTYAVYIGGATEQAALTMINADALEISESP
jgi:hypothetical protein